MNRLIATLLIASVCAGPAFADSLYPLETGTTLPCSLFSDTKAHKVGDILTVVITEQATGSSQGETKTSRNDAVNFGGGTGSLLSSLGAFGVSGNSATDGVGSSNRTDALTATIAVTVKQVLPNGNLLVEGNRQVGINAENQQMTLTGLVRPQDIAPNDTVQSPLVADAQIKYSGKGPVGDKQRMGLIPTLFKWLF